MLVYCDDIMLKKRQRLSRIAFEQLLKHGKRMHGTYLTLLHLSTESVSRKTPAGYVCGVVVSKKVFKSAVARHRVRRKIYEVLRSQSGHLSGKQVAVLLRPAAAGVPFETLQAEVCNLAQKVSFFTTHDEKNSSCGV